MKRLGLVVLSVMLSTLTFGQSKYGTTEADSVTCIEALATYKTYIKAEPKLALELWRQAYVTCPGSRKTLYTNGAKIYKHFVKAEKDPAKKALLVDTLLSIYDQRIEYFGQKCYVLGRKGQTMLSYASKRKEETFQVLNESIELCGDKSGSGTLVAAMFAIINLEKADKKTHEEVVAMYEKTMAICAANKNHPKYAAKYAKAEDKINNVTGKYLSCEVLVPMAEKGYETNRTNVVWLGGTVKLLKRKRCYSAAIFAKVAVAYFDSVPSAASAEGLAKLMVSQKKYSEAINFYKKALEMSDDDIEKAEICMGIAKVYSYKGSYSQARTYAYKAAKLDSDWGEPYIFIGDLYAGSSKKCDDTKLAKWGVYWAAVDKYKKAKALDSSVASNANKKIASMSARYPTTKELFFFGNAKGDAYTVGCWIKENTTIRVR